MLMSVCGNENKYWMHFTNRMLIQKYGLYVTFTKIELINEASQSTDIFQWYEEYLFVQQI